METRIFGKRRYVYKGSIAWYCIKGKSKLGEALRYLWESRSVIALILFVACITLGFMLIGTPKANATEMETVTEMKVASSSTEMQFYDIPLDKDLQRHITEICDVNDIDPKLVFAVIERESQYNPNVIGDSGESFGLMQVQPKWHEARMERLGVTDLLDPYQNVLVGIDYLAECVREYKTVEDALTVYNAGANGAYELYFSKGIVSPYALDVMEIMEREKK